MEKTKISYNIDGPEGSLDAMMQVVACDKVCIMLYYLIKRRFLKRNGRFKLYLRRKLK